MRAPVITFGPFAFDTESRLLRKAGIELPLPPRVLGVLEVLLRRPGDVVRRQELMETVWKDAFVTDTSLAEAVSVLRQTLGDDPQAPSYIQTLHRRGYRFVAPVTEETGTLNFSGARATKDTTYAPEKLSVPVSPSITRQLLPWSVAAICLLLAAAAVREAVRDRAASVPPVTRLVVPPSAGTRFDNRAPSLAVSADASNVAWSGCDDRGCRLYVRSSDRLDGTPIAGTDDAAAPFFSPDGRWIGFFADGHLKKVSLGGGAPVTLAEAADPLGAVWTPQHGIIYAGAGPGLRKVPENGGEAADFTVPRSQDGEVRHVWPSHHEAANVVLFTILGVPQAGGSGRLASMRLDSAAGRWTTLLAGVGRAATVSADAIVFSSASELQAVPFDGRRGITGAPQTVLDGLATAGTVGQFAASPGGSLITIGAATGTEPPSLFWWIPAADARVTGRPQEIARTRELDGVALSPDGRRVAGYDASSGARPDLWIRDLERGTASRLTQHGVNAAPVWSPDGARILYASSDGGAFAIYERDAESARPPRRLHSAAGHAIPSSISPNGSLLAFTSTHAATGADVWGLPLDGGPVQPLIRTPFDDVAAVFSPDGRLLAYQSNEAGRWEIYLHRRTESRRFTVSTDGGTHPFWSADGRALYFRSNGKLMSAAVSADGAAIAQPETLVRFPDAVPVAADGSGRILFQRGARMSADTAVLALQWVREVRQMLGPPSAAMPR